MKKVGVLAVQGAFAEQATAFRDIGADVFEIRQLSDLQKPMDALVLPGGESTVQGKLLTDLGMFKPLQEMIRGGLPVFATCAGLILLAHKIVDDPTVWLSCLPVTVKRNAYGRQLGSFQTCDTWGKEEDVPMTFIRAPRIETLDDPEVRILSTHGGYATAVGYKNIAAFAWHPELTSDRRTFERFLAGRF